MKSLNHLSTLSKFGHQKSYLFRQFLIFCFFSLRGKPAMINNALYFLNLRQHIGKLAHQKQLSSLELNQNFKANGK